MSVTELKNKRDTLIELWSPMPSNMKQDRKHSGDFIFCTSEDALYLVAELMHNKVEFAIYEVGDCLVDKSYKYWLDMLEEENEN